MNNEGSNTSPRPVADGRQVIGQTFVSMDGVMQAPGGPEEDQDGGFQHGGWSMTYWDEKMGQIMAKAMAEPRDLLLGRRTYDIFAGYWPKHPGEPGASSLNGATKYVASHTRRDLEWENSHILHGDTPTAVAELKRKPGPPIYVLGSSNLLQTLFKHDLVDALDLWVFPIVLSSGKRLFHDGSIPTAWRLKTSEASTTGVLIQRYERAGNL
jgi:dihydrofolate reductase